MADGGGDIIGHNAAMDFARNMQFATLAIVTSVGTSVHLWLTGRVPAHALLLSDGLSIFLCVLTLTWVMLARDWSSNDRSSHARWYRQILIIFWVGTLYLLATMFAVAPHVGAPERMMLTTYVVFQIAMATLATIRRSVAGERGLEGTLLPIVPAVGTILCNILFPYAYSNPISILLVICVLGLIGGREFVQQRMNRQHAATLAAQAERDAEISAKQAFLAAASHDLDQPLQAARLSWDQALDSTGAERARSVARMDRAFDAMEAMVTQISQHLRLEAGAVAADNRALALGGVLSQVVGLHEPAARLAGVDLRTQPSRLQVRGDADLIARVLGNFTVNALRHGKPGRLLIGARKHGDRVRLWSIDDGRGLGGVDPESLFGDYTRGNHGGEIRGGLGIGLASARRMASLMHGTVGIDSRWTGGCAFYLDLPAA